MGGVTAWRSPHLSQHLCLALTFPCLTLINLSSRPSAADSGDNKRNNPADLCDRKLSEECGSGSAITGLSLSLSFFPSASRSDVEKSLLTLKAGYRNIRGGVLKAVRGKRQINTFHIPLQWSAIDHGPPASAAPLRSPAWSVCVCVCIAAKRAILIRRDGSELCGGAAFVSSTVDLFYLRSRLRPIFPPRLVFSRSDRAPKKK